MGFESTLAIEDGLICCVLRGSRGELLGSGGEDWSPSAHCGDADRSRGSGLAKVDTLPVSALAGTVALLDVDSCQDVSREIFWPTNSRRICSAVSLSTTTIGPPQSGQVRPPLLFCAELAPTAAHGGESISSNWRHRDNKGGTATMGEKTKEPDTHKSSWKDMQEETPEELLRGECHQPVFISVRVILPAKRDLAVREINQTLVGESHPMCVAGQIV